MHAHTDTMNANIAELIMGLDDITNSFSNDFNEMRNKTGMEKFVGIFALYLDERGPVSVADTSASSPRSVTQRRNGVMLWQTVQSLLVTPAVFRASVNPPQTSLSRKR